MVVENITLLHNDCILVESQEGQWINIRVTMYYTSLFHRIFSLSAHLTRKIISGELLPSLGICKLSTF